MRKPVALTDRQREAVRAAAATLRLSARDAFLQDLAVELARCPAPISDLDLRVALRTLLGVTPVRDTVHEADA
jgi:hypothetical protein